MRLFYLICFKSALRPPSLASLASKLEIVLDELSCSARVADRWDGMGWGGTSSELDWRFKQAGPSNKQQGHRWLSMQAKHSRPSLGSSLQSTVSYSTGSVWTELTKDHYRYYAIVLYDCSTCWLCVHPSQTSLSSLNTVDPI